MAPVRRSRRRAACGGLAVGLSIALWNYIGWDNASHRAGRSEATRRASYPRALAFALPLVMLGYFVPLLSTLGRDRLDHVGRTAAGPQIAGGRGRERRARGSRRWIALRRNGQRARAVQCAPALVFAHSVRDGAGRPAAAPLASTDPRGTPRAAVIVSAVLLLGFRSGAVRQAWSSPTCCSTRSRCCSSSARWCDCAERSRSCAGRSGFRSAGAASRSRGVPMVVLIGVVLSFLDGEYGVPAVIGAAVAIALGPVMYKLASRSRPRETTVR